MRVLVIQHEDECPPARFGGWLTEAGVALDVRRPYAGDVLPHDLAGHDGLVVLGGQMGANDDDEHAWLAPTKELVRAAARDGVPTLGICLGHQIVAVALGGTVDRNPRGRQIGVLDVGWTADAATDALVSGLATPRQAVQWNQDLVLESSPGAVLLAATEHGEVQALRFAPTVWGIQWHPEATPAMVREWASDEPGPRADAGLVEVEAADADLERSWRDLGKAFAATLTA
ncbi:type 1 glutamine amidotransferase [Nocardioides humilatus]|uniref:Type 1 glutamine amidotransferase n=1 Tax=Nocardioides humilatus TaxID=2607660 RepID=A0A5B1L827_9ACTN|nr:type 1 glutamine amidotransferase [Nocardioides humilatus]KAA1416871.1 type 1 glutamine amidotransferase [Nocardioides humilatus]